MDFTFTEEQQMIRDTIESFLTENSSSKMIRDVMKTEQGYNIELWNRICKELYFQAIIIPEKFGGMELGFIELISVMEQMGRFLFCSPYFSTACMASIALLVSENEEKKIEYFNKILSGETATFAFTNNLNWNASGISTRYKIQKDKVILNGKYSYVIDGHTSQFIIVAAKNDKNEIGLFIIDANSEGLTRQWLPTMDQTRKQANLILNNVKTDIILAENAENKLNKILHLSTICLAAEQLGGAQQVLDMAVSYTKERIQFNRPIASFQSIKHKAADMMTRCEAARSGVYYAACVAQDANINGPLSNKLAEASSIVKASCSEAFFKNAGEGIQLYGGVGFTWEYDIHMYFKRAKATEHFLGDASYHQELLAKILLT